MLGKNRVALCKSLNTFFWILLLVLTTRLTNAGAQEQAGLILPPGAHPRLLFTQEDLPILRERAQTSDGQLLLQGLRQTGESVYKDFKKQGAKAVGTRLPVGTLAMAFTYVITGSEQDGKVAREMFTGWLTTFPPDEEIKKINSWGEPYYAMAYDWIYEQLTEAERRRAQKIFTAILATLPETFKTAWWLGGPRANGRNTDNWTPIAAAAGDLTNLALEGEPGYNETLHRGFIIKMRTFLDEGISMDGGMFEGVQYPMNYGTHPIPFYLIALRKRGFDLVTTTNLRQVPFWFTYEMLPWGGEAQAINKSNGGFQAANFTTFLASEFDSLADWVFLHGRGWMASANDFNSPEAAIIALVSGIPARPDNPNDLARLRLEPFWDWRSISASLRPDGLPLGHWFSSIGRVISRSGWGWRDAHVTVNTNPLGAGHTHADHGSFTFAAQGVNFIVDSGYSYYASSEHNLVLIDGLAQSEKENATESFIRAVDFSDYADITDIDLKLAYDRFLSGDGPWYWEDYNPVEKAERRVIFVRGLSGPLLVVADDIRKDDREREYDWLAHSGPNNELTVDGRRFWIKERYGGKFVYSLGKGQKCALIARDVPVGKYRGWLLVRGIPYPAKWANTSVAVNGKVMPYNTTYFGLGNFGQGWYWVPLLPQGPKGDPSIEVSGGELRVDLTSVTGAQVALAVFTRNPDWQPGFAIPKNSPDFFVLDVNQHLQQGVEPWGVAEDPRSILEGVFLGKNVPRLEVSTSKATQYPVLHAVHRAVDARYLCLMSPYEEGKVNLIELPETGGNQVAVVRSPQGVDLVGGAIDGRQTEGDLVTDAVAAVVSLAKVEQPETMRGYTLVSGRSLRYRSMPLVEASQAVTVINDSKRLVVRGPGGIKVFCARLQASQLVINGQESSLPATAGASVLISIPQLPETWNVRELNSGEIIEVSGNGPLPLKVFAPKAKDVRVNGVSRYFIRDGEGYIWPLLQNGTGYYTYANELKTSELLKILRPDIKAEKIILPYSRQEALRFNGSAVFNLKNLIPGRYTLVLGYGTEAAEGLEIQIGDRRFTFAGSTPTGSDTIRKRTEEIVLRVPELELKISGKNFVLTDLRLEPCRRLLPANLWMTIGPFATPVGPCTPQWMDQEVKAALAVSFPPEKELDFAAEYKGADGRSLKWQHTEEKTSSTFIGEGVNFYAISGVKSNDIYYAVTFITSPEERVARLWLACDYWANVYLNGQPVRSERPLSLVETDGAQFKGFSFIPAELKLQKGVNTLLIKVQSGSGGSGFGAYITDPGDLTFSPLPSSTVKQ